ncbi:MAG: lipocalin-like domain-containing protein [Gammaproteobacteria bacterium]
MTGRPHRLPPRGCRCGSSEGEVAIDLRFARGKPPVPHGDRGLSQKSADPGNASYCYSLTRVPTEGIVTVGPERFTVSGLSWMDRKWSTSALGPDQKAVKRPGSFASSAAAMVSRHAER